jgi:hypothetical protein
MMVGQKHRTLPRTTAASALLTSFTIGKTGKPEETYGTAAL